MNRLQNQEGNKYYQRWSGEGIANGSLKIPKIDNINNIKRLQNQDRNKY